ncbi:hypothetical protein FXO38_33402 [Capsicum annuum]|nr:hypothetical protein FXO38_33402 [Capsicum annuum]
MNQLHQLHKLHQLQRQDAGKEIIEHVVGAAIGRERGVEHVAGSTRGRGKGNGIEYIAGVARGMGRGRGIAPVITASRGKGRPRKIPLSDMGVERRTPLHEWFKNPTSYTTHAPPNPHVSSVYAPPNPHASISKRLMIVEMGVLIAEMVSQHIILGCQIV